MSGLFWFWFWFSVRQLASFGSRESLRRSAFLSATDFLTLADSSLSLHQARHLIYIIITLTLHIFHFTYLYYTTYLYDFYQWTDFRRKQNNLHKCVCSTDVVLVCFCFVFFQNLDLFLKSYSIFQLFVSNFLDLKPKNLKIL